ncbi:MAG: hypothetical protein OXU73_01250 [Candidatus Campbellbacteria bacterium]|nr:hypothetical protein [Candidatus Campbellbacteria bacterium]
MIKRRRYKKIQTVGKVIFSFVIALLIFFLYYFFFNIISGERAAYHSKDKTEDVANDEKTLPIKVIHLETPDEVRSIYATACAVATPSFRKRIKHILDTTDINSIVIDVKDFSGTVQFIPHNKPHKTKDADGCVIKNLREYLHELHERGIYTIARVTVFQDPYFATRNPHLAVQKESDKSVWKDNKGLSFVDPLAAVFWQYIVEIAVDAYNEGFDEINFDYIRFPSDGDLSDVYYPLSESRVSQDPDFGKAEVIEDFFKYINDEMRKKRNIPTSADIFGQAAVNTDDLNIGQVLEKALPYFDAIALMLYPSHFLPNFAGIPDPNRQPGKVIEHSLSVAKIRAVEAGYGAKNLRSWVQDFDYPVAYGKDKVVAQIDAIDDASVGGFMVWDPSVRYTPTAFAGSQKVNKKGVEN